MERFFFIFLLIFLQHSPTIFSQTNYTEKDSLLAIEYYRDAVNFGRKNEPEKALELFRKSLEYRKKIFGEKHIRLGGTYMGMAIQYKNLFQLDNAFRYFRFAEDIYENNISENDSRFAEIYTNIANYFQLKGDLSEAIRYNQRAIQIFESTNDPYNPISYYSAIFNLANTLHQVNYHTEALSVINKYQNKTGDFFKIEYLNLKASIYSSMLEHNRSKEILRSVIDMIKKEYGKDSYEVADQYTAYGQFFININQPDSGIIYFTEAEKIYLLHGNTQRDLGELYRSFASAWYSKTVNSSSVHEFQSIKTMNLNKSIEYSLKALHLLNGDFNSGDFSVTDFEKSNFQILNLRILNDLGQSWQQLARILSSSNNDSDQKYLGLALMALTAASDLAIQMRTSFISDDSKMMFAELQQFIFPNTISAAYDLFQVTNSKKYFDVALENAGRAKAATLFDNISEMQARESSLIPDSLSELENLYNSNLAYYRERLYEENLSAKPDTIKVREFQQHIFSNEQKRTELRALLEKNYQDYYQLKYARRNLFISDLQKKMKRNESIVEFAVHNGTINETGSIYIFAISKEAFQFRKEPFNQETQEKIETLYKSLSTTEFINSGLAQFKSYCESAYYLYNKLLFPLFPVISEKRLTIVPDGILSYIPFEALLTQRPETNRIHYHDLNYLILDYPVNYAYSTELFMRSGTKPIIRKKQTIAFAPDYLTARYNDESISQLAAIPGIFEEVKYLSKSIRADFFKGEQATEANFRQTAGDYDILHLAMHTLINDSIPAFSRLAFYPGNANDLNDDGWFNTSDIYNLRLIARMAVLSACNTGSGILRKGEGVMSLARGFFYAGCPSVVMTLWEVEDRSGTEIMKEFYNNLKAGKPKDIALRNAKLKHIRNSDPFMSHPHFWMGYITIGRSDPLFSGNEVYFFSTIFLIALMMVADHLRKKMTRSRRAC